MDEKQTFWDLVAAAARASGLSNLTERDLLFAFAFVLTAVLAAAFVVGLVREFKTVRTARSRRAKKAFNDGLRRKTSANAIVWALVAASVAILATVETPEKALGPNSLDSAETVDASGRNADVADEDAASSATERVEECVADAKSTAPSTENAEAENVGTETVVAENAEAENVDAESKDASSTAASDSPAPTVAETAKNDGAAEPISAVASANGAKPFEPLKTQSDALADALKFAETLKDVPTVREVAAPKEGASTWTPGTYRKTEPETPRNVENADPNDSNAEPANDGRERFGGETFIPYVERGRRNGTDARSTFAADANAAPTLASATSALESSRSVAPRPTTTVSVPASGTAVDGLSTRAVQPAYNESVAAPSVVAPSRLDSARAVAQASFSPERPILPYPVSQASATFGSNASNSVRFAAVGAASNAFSEPSGGTDLSDSLLARLDDEYSRVSGLVGASVLPIETLKLSGGPSQKKIEETGCGFLAQYDGRVFLLTNRHVVVNALGDESIKIFLPDGRVAHPTKTTSCADFDLAVLELNADDLPKDGSVSLCYFGDSDSLRVASMVGAVGNPFGLDHSIAFGRVSSVGRRNLPLNKADKKSINEYIQIDCAINPGNSGGPLFNARGEVVGIVTAIATTSGKNEGVAFAVPINTALTVVRAMIETGEWRRSQMGVELLPAKASDFGAANAASARGLGGAKIAKVWGDSPAERAGLREGDVVVSFDGEKIDDDWRLARTIALTPADERPVLGVVRGGRYVEIQTTLARAKNENER